MNTSNQYLNKYLETYFNFINIYFPSIDPFIMNIISISLMLMILSIPLILFGNIVGKLFFIIFKIIAFLIIISIIGITIFILKS
jgi:hypothetical protein